MAEWRNGGTATIRSFRHPSIHHFLTPTVHPNRPHHIANGMERAGDQYGPGALLYLASASRSRESAANAPWGRPPRVAEPASSHSTSQRLPSAVGAGSACHDRRRSSCTSIRARPCRRESRRGREPDAAVNSSRSPRERRIPSGLCATSNSHLPRRSNLPGTRARANPRSMAARSGR